MNKKIILTALLTILGVLVVQGYALSYISNQKLSNTKAKGEVVMGFDLDQTQHYFHLTSTGLVMAVKVESNSSEFQSQVLLVRAHLADLTSNFTAKDFSQPKVIHGSSMPGLAKLASSDTNLLASYSDLDAGAVIKLSTSDPQTLNALSLWMETQLQEHGKDASIDSNLEFPQVPFQSQAVTHNHDNSMDAMITTKKMWLLHHPGTTPPVNLK